MLKTSTTRSHVTHAALSGLSQPPDVLARILSVVLDDSCTAIDLANEIDGYPELSSRILRLINSSCYGLDWAVTSIPDAAVSLGFDEVERIALAVAVVDMFGKSRVSVKTLRLLWRHSLASSVAAGVIEQRNRFRTPQIQGAHIAAMLHDIGKAALALQYPQDLVRVTQRVLSGDDPCDAERAIFGVTHSEVGAWLAESWGLPEGIVQSIRLHHVLDEVVEHEPMPHAVHVANCLVKKQGIPSGNGREMEAMNEASREFVGLDGHLASLIEMSLKRSHCVINAVSSGAMYDDAPSGRPGSQAEPSDASICADPGLW